MADASLTSEGFFEDGENLQTAIGKALQEKKALLCFVYQEDDEQSDQWQAALRDGSIRERLQSTTVLLRLKSGSDQAGFLNGVCPILNVPAIVIIHNAKLVANYQNGQTTYEDLQKELRAKYSQSGNAEGLSFTSVSNAAKVAHLELPPSGGRMRLPNNAYDELRKLTQEQISKGVTGKSLLDVQLSTIEGMNIDIVTKAVNDIRQSLETNPAPTLPDQVTDKLLNTPASRLRNASTLSERQGPLGGSTQSPSQVDSQPVQQPSTTQPSQSPPQNASTRTPTTNTPQNQSVRQQPFSPPSNTTNTPTTTHPSQSDQRTQYVATQKAREAAASAERARIKAQIAADKAARRESEAAAAAEQRRVDLQNLRKANSTTSDPKASDVRIQVRLFDGSTIRNSFAAEATIARDVRGWIDGEVTGKTSDMGSAGTSAGQPYDLKLILTPLPNRTIEAGEEDQALCDLDGVKGSATLVMVPVKGFVDSYSGVSGGVVGGVVGGAASMVGAGIGLMGSAAGMVVGGLGRLLGGGGGVGGTAQQQQQAQHQGDLARDSGEGTSTGGGRSNMRVRTLADQRRDEDEERRRKGTQLYNGMGLNVQPRKDDKDDETK